MQVPPVADMVTSGVCLPSHISAFGDMVGDLQQEGAEGSPMDDHQPGPSLHFASLSIASANCSDLIEIRAGIRLAHSKPDTAAQQAVSPQHYSWVQGWASSKTQWTGFTYRSCTPPGRILPDPTRLPSRLVPVAARRVQMVGSGGPSVQPHQPRSCHRACTACPRYAAQLFSVTGPLMKIVDQ